MVSLKKRLPENTFSEKLKQPYEVHRLQGK